MTEREHQMKHERDEAAQRATDIMQRNAATEAAFAAFAEAREAVRRRDEEAYRKGLEMLSTLAADSTLRRHQDMLTAIAQQFIREGFNRHDATRLADMLYSGRIPHVRVTH